MTTYYVDWEKADNSGNGLTLATAKKTLNGAEDIPVAAGDFVWVRPGVYREMLTVDVSGSSGSPITYQGDVAGQIWHPGGVVRITGSNDDLTITRSQNINSGSGGAGSTNYRTFKGFNFGMVSDAMIFNNKSDYWIVEDCVFANSDIWTVGIEWQNGVGNNIIRRCLFYSLSAPVQIRHDTLQVDDKNNLVENCIFIGGDTAIGIHRVGGTTIRNCLFLSHPWAGVYIPVALSNGQTTIVENCIFRGIENAALVSTVDPATNEEITEDFNDFFGNNSDRDNVSVGANSTTDAPNLDISILLSGHRLPWKIGELLPSSPVARRTDSGSAPSDDLYGLTRPVTNGKRSWGPIQFTGAVRETTITDGGGASLKLPDAGEQFFMRVPTSASEITIAVKVYREANYAGTLPQLVIRQPGQADETDTDAGSAEQFNTLSVTLTPDALPPWVDVFIRSNNTAAAGDYATYWDTLTVT